jgi:hypothetical protein
LSRARKWKWDLLAIAWYGTTNFKLPGRPNISRLLYQQTSKWYVYLSQRSACVYANSMTGWRSQSPVSVRPRPTTPPLSPESSPNEALIATIQISEARLVTGGWLVRSAFKLEGQHGCLRLRNVRHHRTSMEAQRREGVPTQDARARSLLSQQIVSSPTMPLDFRTNSS